MIAPVASRAHERRRRRLSLLPPTPVSCMYLILKLVHLEHLTAVGMDEKLGRLAWVVGG